MLKSRWTVLTLVALLLGLAARLLAAKDATGEQHPILRAPKLAAAPTIDGTIKADEWSRAAAFTGVTAEGSVGGHGSLVPSIQQVQWYLGYDDKYLYIAMRSTHPRGTYPVARTKENDLVAGHPPILFEDHVEVQILSHGRRGQASTQGKGFYKIMANPKGALTDQFLFNGTPGTEEHWSMGGPLKCSVTPETWELEMAVELSRMGVKALDGRDLVIQLVRTDSCTGMYFAGWVGTHWMDWQHFGRVDFAADTPAFRFLKLGEIGAGELDATVELVGGKTAADVTVDVLVENADGKVIHKDSRTVKLAADATEKLNLKQAGLAISKVDVADRGRRNHFEIKATAKLGRQDVVLYQNRSPFMQFDDEFRKQFLDKWIAGRPQSGEWEYRIAYLPYSNKVEASVDLDFFGVPEAIQQAKRYRVNVTGKGQDKVLGKGEGEIEALAGPRIVFDVPALADGQYVAKFELLDGAGKPISAKEAEFVRKAYPWERNTLGISDEVIPPFKPLEVKNGNSVVANTYHYTGREIKDGVWMWGRIYSVGGNGLPEQIDTAPPTGTFGGARRLLATPIRFEAVTGGKAADVRAGDRQFVNKQMHRVDIAGAQTTGPVKAEVKAFVEYDGWYEVEATLSGSGAVDAVDLLIDLDDQPGSPIDTLYVQRLGDSRQGNLFTTIAAKPGLCFKSTDLMGYRGGSFDWKSFVPRTFVGNGDRGLWFFGWSATGWELKDDQPVVQVERLKDGDVRLRVRILAGPVDLGQPRTVKFALQATPVKPNHPRYRTANEEDIFMHDTRGYRYYGISVDDFVNTNPGDYDALRKFILYGQRYQGDEQRKGKKNYGWWHGHYMDTAAHGGKIIMYGSGQLTGMGPEEFKTFGGEWLGRSNWRANRDAASDTGRWNYQGTSQWTSDEQVSVTGMNWTPSAIDFFVWYHKPLMEKAGFNGTWWDNNSMGIVRSFNPALGRMEETWLLYARRQLIKRLHVLGWEMMRPPMWASNMHVDLGFAEVFWMVENDWYSDGADMTSLDQWSLGEFRAMARTKSTMQIARPWLGGFRGTTPEMDQKIQRSLVAMMMSHDIHPNPMASGQKERVGGADLRNSLYRFRGLVDLPNTGACQFAGYWLTDAMVKTTGQGVAASVYTNPTLRSAAVLLFNTAKKDQYLAGTALDINALIPIRGEALTARRIFDLESGNTIPTVFEDGKYVIKDPLLVRGHEFRLLGVEAE